MNRTPPAPSLVGVLICCLFAVSAWADSPVTVDGSKVRGVREGNLLIYKGIPFAAAPIGDLRWRPPQRVAPWKGVLNADHFPAQCPQLGPPLPTMPEERSSEDCLYLNVFGPAAAPKERLPVVVFLPGGGFARGSASTPLYASGGWPARFPVLLITINYRLGYLGFMTHPELSAESAHHSSGNYAFLDVIAALEWAKRNAGAFGGDANNITLMGQSAGSYLVNELMVSPLAEGLFVHAIAESGAEMTPSRTAYGMAVLKDAERGGLAFADLLHAHSLADLRRIPAEQLVQAEFNELPGLPETNQKLPVIDGWVIPGDVGQRYAEGKQIKVPLLLGYSRDENESLEADPRDRRLYEADVRAKYGTFSDRLLALFPADSDESAGRSAARLGAERTYAWQMYAWARANSRTSPAPTFFYVFDTNYGSAHGSELPFVFQYPFGGPWNAQQRAIALKIDGYWTQFARTGNPNGGSLPAWQAFEPAHGRIFMLGKENRDVGDPDLAAHRVMDEFMIEELKRRDRAGP